MNKALTKETEIMKQPLKSALLGGASVLAAVGTVLIPAAAFAAVDTKTTTVNAILAPVISMTTGTTVNINITPTPSGAASNGSDTVTVATNRSTGYNLKLAGATVTLVSGANNIAAASGSFASPAALGNNSWGYRVDNAGTFGAGPTSTQTNQASLAGTWASVPTVAQTIKTTATTATADVTTVWYGVMADTSKPDGTYADIITYTATTN